MSKDLAMKILRWQSDCNVGISSATMASIACGLQSNIYGSCFNAPLDPADLKRCIDLVDKVPEIRSCFPAIAEKVGNFGPILSRWDELVAMLRKEIETGNARAPETYKRMKELHASHNQHNS